MVAIDLNKYLSQTIQGKVNRIGQENLERGVNYVYQGKTYHIQMLEKHDASGSLLIFQIYSNTESHIQYYVKNTKKFSHLGNKEIKIWAITGRDGQKVGGWKKPTFRGTLSPEEQAFYQKHGLTMENPWSSKAKGVALIAMVLGCSALGYGMKKLKDHGKLKMPDLPPMPDLSAYSPTKLWEKMESYLKAPSLSLELE